MGSKSTVIHVTEEEVWGRIRSIYAKWPEFLDYPEDDWCECNGCQEAEVAERHGWGSEALRDWQTLRNNLFLAGVDWDYPEEDE